MASQNQREQKQIERAQIVVDQVIEYLGMKWTKSQIFNHLRGTFPDLRRRTVRALIRQAGKDIMARYGIDPEQYKGEQIAFYEYVVRGRSYDTKEGCAATVKERLVAAERLDKLFNLENIVNSDPADKAAQIIEFIKQAGATVGSGINPNDVDKDVEPDKEVEDDTESRDIHKADGNTESSRQDGAGRSTVDDTSEVEVEVEAEVEVEVEDEDEDKPKAKADDSGDDLDEDGDILEEFGQEMV